MSPAAVLKKVKDKYPELSNLPKAQLKLVEAAVVYASKIDPDDELVTQEEHDELMRKLGPITPGGSLCAYRNREELTQAQLAKKSGIPQANISAMENGKRTIGLKMAKKLAGILNCRYEKLVSS